MAKATSCGKVSTHVGSRRKWLGSIKKPPAQITMVYGSC